MIGGNTKLTQNATHDKGKNAFPIHVFHACILARTYQYQNVARAAHLILHLSRKTFLCTMTPITIQALSWAHPDATALREAQQLEIDHLRPRGLGKQASAANVPIFLVAYDGSEPVACGGLRPLSSVGLPGQAEIKRMYVVPSRRAPRETDSGGRVMVAQLVLEALEGIARENGWMTVKIQTSVVMARARRFYEKYGLVRCELYGLYEGVEGIVCYEKRLA